MIQKLDNCIVCESLTAEHRRTEHLLDAMESLLSDISLQEPIPFETRAELDEMLTVLIREMNVHFACEEQCLFPVLSNYHPMVLMEVEHEELIDLRNQLEQSFRDSEQTASLNASVQQIGLELIDELRKHIAREDAGIFPLAERDLSLEEKQDIIARMNALRNRSVLEAIPPIQRAPKTYRKLELDLETPVEQPVQIHKLLDKDSLQVKQVTLQAGQSLSSHWSPRQTMILGITGQATVTVDGNQEPLVLGKAYLLSPRLLHAVSAETDCHFLVIANPGP